MPAPTRRPFYPELSAELARQGLSHTELAAAADCAPGTLTHLLRGRMRPSPALRARIAEALRRDEQELFTVDEDAVRAAAERFVTRAMAANA